LAQEDLATSQRRCIASPTPAKLNDKHARPWHPAVAAKGKQVDGRSNYSEVRVQSEPNPEQRGRRTESGWPAMTFKETRPYADPDAAARKIVELANSLEPYMDGRLLVERINGPFLYEVRGTPAEYKADLDRAIEKGWLEMHESGTYLRFTQAGADLFA
jgi:hypothetical protein